MNGLISQKKLVAMGIVVTLVCILGLLFYERLMVPLQESQKVALSLNTDGVRSLTLKIGDRIVTIQKNNNTWGIKEWPDFPLDSAVVDRILKRLGGLTATHRIPIEQPLSFYGLEPALQEVMLQSNRSQSSISIGALNSSGTERYVRINQEKDLFMVPQEQTEYLFLSPFSLHQNKVFEINLDQITGINITQDGRDRFLVKRLTDGWWFIEDETKYKASTNRINQLDEALDHIVLKENKTAKMSELSIDNAMSFELFAGRTTYYFTNTSEGVLGWEKGENQIYSVSKSILKWITIDTSFWLDRTPLSEISLFDVDEIQINSDGERVVVDKNKGQAWVTQKNKGVSREIEDLIAGLQELECETEHDHPLSNVSNWRRDPDTFLILIKTDLNDYIVQIREDGGDVFMKFGESRRVLRVVDQGKGVVKILRKLVDL